MKVRTSVTATGKGGRRAEADEGSEKNGSAGADGRPRLGTRYIDACPFCGNEADATFKEWPDGSGWIEWQVGCRKRACEANDLPSLAEAYGLPVGATKAQIAGAMRARSRGGRRRESAELPALPSDALVAGWQLQLDGPKGSTGRNYLRRRGVAPDVRKALRIGWDGARLTLPMYDPAGILAGFKTRVPRPKPHRTNSINGHGRPWPLYPAVDRAAGWVLLGAGEFDALAGRSQELPATSITLGAGRPAENNKPANAGPGSPWWRPEWTDELRGLRVVVCFDNDEQPQAREVVARLREAGVRADRLDLRTLGLDTPKGDLNDYLRAGGDPSRLHPRRRTIRTRTTRKAAKR